MYETADFYSAVVLRTMGFRLTDVKREGRKSFFVFDTDNQSRTPDDVLQEFWDNELMIPARKFVDNISELKTRLYDYR